MSAAVEIIPLTGTSPGSPSSAERNMGMLQAVNETRKRKRKHSEKKSSELGLREKFHLLKNNNWHVQILGVHKDQHPSQMLLSATINVKD